MYVDHSLETPSVRILTTYAMVSTPEQPERKLGRGLLMYAHPSPIVPLFVSSIRSALSQAPHCHPGFLGIVT